MPNGGRARMPGVPVMTIIRVENVSKAYRLRGRRAPRRGIEALEGVSFEVEKGEVVALIGDNGAGKSSMLRMLAGISRPTSGSIRVNGSISTLLDLTAGFRADLDGRQNIRIRCQLQGMDRRQTDAHARSIGEFSELGEDLDRPVRTYSAGMAMRLGFAIATASPSDVLLVDEVLAVGDIRFRRKCVDRIREIVAGGGTLVIASHDTYTVRELCDRALWLEHGKVRAEGDAREVVDLYTDALRDRGDEPGGPAEAVAAPADPDRDPFPPVPARPTVEPVVQPVHQKDLVALRSVRIHGGDGDERDEFRTLEPLVVEVTVEAFEELDRPILGVAIHRNDGVYCYGPNTSFDGVETGSLRGRFTYSLRYPALPLLSGVYHLSLGVFDHEHLMPYLYLPNERTIRVRSDRKDYGMVVMEHGWSIAGGD